ncbi:MAG: hypothetical protein ACJAS1_001454 [Oleiphilaceae bacterium]|jgi:hypothetical protein
METINYSTQRNYLQKSIKVCIIFTAVFIVLLLALMAYFSFNGTRESFFFVYAYQKEAAIVYKEQNKEFNKSVELFSTKPNQAVINLKRLQQTGYHLPTIFLLNYHYKLIEVDKEHLLGINPINILEAGIVQATPQSRYFILDFVLRKPNESITRYFPINEFNDEVKLNKSDSTHIAYHLQLLDNDRLFQALKTLF